VLDRLLHALGIALDDDEGDGLARELAGDDLPDPPEAADDEVLVELVEHAFTPPGGPPRLEIALDQPGHEERERVEDGRDADGEHDHREELAAARQRMHFPISGGRHRDDRHVERVPEVPPFYQGVTHGTAGNHDEQQQHRQPPPCPPG
jgi:hypothetical protein